MGGSEMNAALFSPNITFLASAKTGVSGAKGMRSPLHPRWWSPSCLTGEGEKNESEDIIRGRLRNRADDRRRHSERRPHGSEFFSHLAADDKQQVGPPSLSDRFSWGVIVWYRRAQTASRDHRPMADRMRADDSKAFKRKSNRRNFSNGFRATFPAVLRPLRSIRCACATPLLSSESATNNLSFVPIFVKSDIQPNIVKEKLPNIFF